jgi:hypothetical protein
MMRMITITTCLFLAHEIEFFSSMLLVYEMLMFMQQNGNNNYGDDEDRQTGYGYVGHEVGTHVYEKIYNQIKPKATKRHSRKRKA